MPKYQVPNDPERKQAAIERTLEARRNEAECLRLRLEGMEFEEIAAKVGFTNRGTAYNAFKRALAKIPAEETREARAAADMRLNVALAAIWPRVRKGDDWAIDRMLAIEERRAKLLGLDSKEVSDVGPIEVKVIVQGGAHADAAS